MSIERRIISTRLELRQSAGEAGPAIWGYAAKFNRLSEPLPGPNGKKFREKIAPGAFKRSLASGKNIACLFGHDINRVLGSTAARTLRCSEDEIGLCFDCDLPDTSDGRDARELVKRGDLSGMSFGFGVDDDSWDEPDDDERDSNDVVAIRTLRQVTLYEISCTTFPAYTDTSVDARSMPGNPRRRLTQEEEKAMWREAFQMQMEK